MSVNVAIIELAQQLSLLQAENQRLQSTINATKGSIPQNYRKISKKELSKKWINNYYEERYQKLCELNREDILQLNARYPGWKPDKASL